MTNYQTPGAQPPKFQPTHVQINRTNPVLVVSLAGGIGLFLLVIVFSTIAWFFAQARQETLKHELQLGNGDQMVSSSSRERFAANFVDGKGSVAVNVPLSGNRFADWKEILMQAGVETKNPASVTDAIAEYDETPDSQRNDFRKAFLIVWIGEQPVDAKLQNQVAKRLASKPRHLTDDALNIFLDWGTEEFAADIVEHHCFLCVDSTLKVAEKFPSDDVKKALAEKVLHFEDRNFDKYISYLKANPMKDPLLLFPNKVYYPSRGPLKFESTRAYQILTAWGEDAEWLHTVHNTKFSSWKELSKLPFDERLQPFVLEKMSKATNFDREFGQCILVWGDERFLPLVRDGNKFFYTEQVVNILEKFPQPESMPLLLDYVASFHTPEKALPSIVSALEVVAPTSSPTEFRQEAVIYASKLQKTGNLSDQKRALLDQFIRRMNVGESR